MLKILLITILLVEPQLVKYNVYGDDFGCDQLKVIIQTTSTSGGSDNGKAEAKVEGGVAPVYYIFFMPNGQLLKKDMDVSSNKVENLKPGKYFCSVTDGAGCTKKIDFTIE